MEEVLKFLKDNPTYYLATMDGSQPRVRPFGTIALFEGRLYFQTGHVKNVYEQLIANPQIEICASSHQGGCGKVLQSGYAGQSNAGNSWLATVRCG